MNEKPWIKNAPTLILVSSIFAALAGALFGITLGDASTTHYLPSILFAISFWLFALSAEEITTAIDDQDVKRYVFLVVFYNLGVVMLFAGSAVLIYFKFSTSLWLTVLITSAAIIYPWGRDLCFLLNPWNKEEMENYLDELEGRREPQTAGGFIAKIFYRIKGISYGMSKKLPHENVFTRLAVSSNHGVGVFAIKDIPSGTNVFADDPSELIWIEVDKLKNLDPQIKMLYNDFCVLKNGKYGCPSNFNLLTVGWYLNESKENPNVNATKNYDFIALRDIKEGEELLSNYSTYSEK
jgi:hypothetical protein